MQPYNWHRPYGDRTPTQRQRVLPYTGNIARQVGGATYGVCRGSDANDSVKYLFGVEVSDPSDLPRELCRVDIPPHRYATFTHDAHISAIRRTWRTINTRWLPASRFKRADGPDSERYSKDFDPERGMGGIEIWIPVRG